MVPASFRFSIKEVGDYDWSHWIAWFRQIGIKAWVETGDGKSWVQRERVEAHVEPLEEHLNSQWAA